MAVIALNGNESYLVQLLIWIRNNPLTFLTGVMVCVTAYYARATTRYVRIAAEQFAAQIEPVPIVTLQNCGWREPTFLGSVAVEATQNSMVVVGGQILLRCEHGTLRSVVELDKWTGHTLSPGQRLVFTLEVAFESAEKGHAHTPSVEGLFLYSDSRNVATYERETLPSGIVRIRRHQHAGRLQRWLLLNRAFWPLRLRIWKVRTMLAIMRGEAYIDGKRGALSGKGRPRHSDHYDDSKDD